MTNLDARGFSCPEPLIMLRNALKQGTPVVLLVDNKVSVENCVSFAKMKGHAVEIAQDGDTYTISIGDKE